MLVRFCGKSQADNEGQVHGITTAQEAPTARRRVHIHLKVGSGFWTGKDSNELMTNETGI